MTTSKQRQHQCTDWTPVGQAGKMRSYTVTLTANASAVALPGLQDFIGGYLLPVKYKSAGDDAWALTLVDADSIDWLNGNGTVAAGNTGGHISPNDRWPITEQLYYTLANFSGTSCKLTFAVAVD